MMMPGLQRELGVVTGEYAILVPKIGAVFAADAERGGGGDKAEPPGQWRSRRTGTTSSSRFPSGKIRI